LLALVRTWPSNKRREAVAYAVAVGALPEGEKYQGEVPSQVRVAIDRAIEWTMTDEEIEQHIAAGPWRTAWLEDDSKKVFHFAEMPPTEEGGEPARGDHGLFETEAEARRCVARLNRQLAIEKNLQEPPPASE
jgi:methionyl-tRNA formyltransferase